VMGGVASENNLEIELSLGEWNCVSSERSTSSASSSLLGVVMLLVSSSTDSLSERMLVAQRVFMTFLKQVIPRLRP
jgi:hypothetical protein